MPTALQVLQEAKERRAVDTSDDHMVEVFEAACEKPTSLRLYLVWRCAWQRTYPQEFIGHWSDKDKANIKQWVREADGAVVAAVIQSVVEDWPGFVAFLGTHAGHKDLGARPSVPLLMYHRAHAVNWATQRASACAQTTEGPSWDF